MESHGEAGHRTSASAQLFATKTNLCKQPGWRSLLFLQRNFASGANLCACRTSSHPFSMTFKHHAARMLGAQ